MVRSARRISRGGGCRSGLPSARQTRFGHERIAATRHAADHGRSRFPLSHGRTHNHRLRLESLSRLRRPPLETEAIEFRELPFIFHFRCVSPDRIAPRGESFPRPPRRSHLRASAKSHRYRRSTTAPFVETCF